MTDPYDDDSFPEIEESPYLRRQKPVEVRRRFNRQNAARVKKVILAGLALVVTGYVAWRIAAFGLYDPRFQLSEDRIEVLGLRYVTRQQVTEKFSADAGRSIFRAPLERRRAMLEEITWVASAAVARVWPDRLRVIVRERVPVAFLRTAAGLALVDAQGVILDRPARANFTFPVLTGVGERDSAETRRERLRIYTALMAELDGGGSHHTIDISEVDLTDPEDARVIVAPRDGSAAVLLHLGSNAFLARYQNYLAHIREWRQQFPKIQSIDLRYERQIVVNPDRR